MQLHMCQKKGLAEKRGRLLPPSFCCSEQPVKAVHIQPLPLGRCYDNQKRWTAGARSGMNRFQCFRHEVGGEGPLSRSVSPEDKTHVRSGRHGKTVWANFWLLRRIRKTNTATGSKQELMWQLVKIIVKRRLNLFYLLPVHSCFSPTRHHSDEALG